MDAVEARLEILEQKLNKKEDATQQKNDLEALRRDLDSLDAQALVDFDKIGKHLQDKGLPAVILNRHEEAVATYRQDMATLKANLDDADRAKDDEDRTRKAKKAKDYLKTKHKKRGPKTKFDPNDLPNKSLQPNRKNVPKLTKEEFTRAGLQSNPMVKLAALGDFKFDKLPGASDPAYLAATTEIVLTDAIKAKAAELQHDPVKIYQWVRNNTAWLPTWGATQDAGVTLGSKQGNALDIAGLLIALYRASGIPARYVHGAIDVPADKFMNWAGGFTDINAAVNFASSGGIPITTVISGGRITKVRLEHIWVEAVIDFYPSRGAVNKSADSWVQLDPSYKQYEYVAGVDVAAVSGLDSNALAQSLSTTGTVNQTESWFSGVDFSIIQNAQSQAQANIEQYVRDNLPNPTIGQVFGGRRIIVAEQRVLPPALPYRAVIAGPRYGSLPGQLQHTMTFAFGIDLIGEPINPVTFPWARLNNHRVTLLFRPATAADETTLNSLLPDDFTEDTPLPTSIPSYLIAVVPEIVLDGQVVAQGNAMRLGEDLNFFYGINRVSAGFHSYTYLVPAGSYLSVAVIGGGVSRHALESLGAKLQQTQTRLNSRNLDLIAGLTREEIMGDMFHVGTLSYFSQYVAFSNITNTARQAQQTLPIAYGTLGYEANVQRLFGLPRAIKPGGVAVNVRLAFAIQPRNGDATKLRGLYLQAGLLSSALEHTVPEQMFSTPTEPVQAVSAVKALQIAAQQGQRIYHVTSANKSQALPNLRLDALALDEINNALVTGKEVIAHTDRISVSGWVGEGYVIFDPVSGAGAYKITGGSNGGITQLLTDFFTFLTAAALGFVDGTVDKHKGVRYLFSDKFQYLAKMAKVSALAGLAAFFVDLYGIWTNDSLSLADKLGRTGMAALGFAATAVVVAGLSLFFGPLAAAILGAAVAFVLALAINVVNSIYFSLFDRKRKVIA